MRRTPHKRIAIDLQALQKDNIYFCSIIPEEFVLDAFQYFYLQQTDISVIYHMTSCLSGGWGGEQFSFLWKCLNLSCFVNLYWLQSNVQLANDLILERSLVFVPDSMKMCFKSKHILSSKQSKKKIGQTCSFPAVLDPCLFPFCFVCFSCP